MKIYKLTQCENTRCDMVTGFVIVANSEEEARGVARDKCADEGPEVWDFAETEEVGTYTGQATTPFVLMADINNG